MIPHKYINKLEVFNLFEARSYKTQPKKLLYIFIVHHKILQNMKPILFHFIYETKLIYLQGLKKINELLKVTISLIWYLVAFIDIKSRELLDFLTNSK